MCGFCGMAYFDADHPIDESVLRRMNATIHHRGPDGTGYHTGPGTGLGFQRLAIIDLERGWQPIYNEDRSIVIVFNGEIYNHRAIRKELRAKHTFSSGADTEVILHGYEEWGEAIANRLRGMFAFVIWDSNERKLLMVRDRLGIKPLYYYRSRHGLVFGSEIKAILEHHDVQRELDHEALDAYLSFLYIPAPKSIWKNLYKLPAGHLLSMQGGEVRVRQYWDIRFGNRTPGLSEEAWCEEVLEALDESVGCHLESDVPLGAFLSGGIDSSAVVSSMSRIMKEPVKTCAIGFSSDRWSEVEHARIVSEQCATAHREFRVEGRALDVLDDLFWHYDEPFADSSALPTYHVSRLAREMVTVALSGDGGDENFAGYRRYYYDRFENSVRSLLPQPARGPVFGALAAVYPKADYLPQPLRAKTLLKNLSMPALEGYFNSMTWFTPAEKELLYRDETRRDVGDFSALSIFAEHFEAADTDDPLSRIQYVDMKTYLVDDILTKVDRASMAVSLEVRVPLLDHVFMERMARIPSGFKLYGRQGKYIFKKAMESRLPESILHRKKMGFSVPLREWWHGELQGDFESSVMREGSFCYDMFQPSAVRKLWQDHQRGLRDNAYKLWILFALEKWAQHYTR
ncbi:MAG: asparagine synthase (glutamine-hydrolyzing) [Candidatus Krumholzibacteriia bacterium]